MNSWTITRRSLLRGASAIPLSAVFAHAIIGKAKAAVVKMRLLASQGDDPNMPTVASTTTFSSSISMPMGWSSRSKSPFFPANQLGQEIDVINSVKLDVIDMMVSGSSISANLVPLVGAFDVGYMFDSLMR